MLFGSFSIKISLPTVSHFALGLWTHVSLRLFGIDLDIFGLSVGFVSYLLSKVFLGFLALLGFALETG